jgi:hypothetical protein
VKYDPELKTSYEVIRKYTDHVAMAAVEWIVTMKQGISLATDDAVMPVMYEKFVKNNQFRQDILGFCSLSEDINFTDYCNDVLKAPKVKLAIKLPVEIANEFNRIMKLLEYEK